jgi:hypothetical protein
VVIGHLIGTPCTENRLISTVYLLCPRACQVFKFTGLYVRGIYVVVVVPITTNFKLKKNKEHNRTTYGEWAFRRSYQNQLCPLTMGTENPRCFGAPGIICWVDQDNFMRVPRHSGHSLFPPR